MELSLSGEPRWCAREAEAGRIIVLPSGHLANVCFLANKMEQVLFLSSRNPDLYQSTALRFTETRLSQHFLDRTLHFQGLQLLQAGDLIEL